MFVTGKGVSTLCAAAGVPDVVGKMKKGFKADINASVSRAETESTLIRAGTSRVSKEPKTSALTPESTPADDAAQLRAIDQDRAGFDAALPASSPTSARPPSLEPSVVLDEQSNYLNHLNQLRRINAGDRLSPVPGSLTSCAC